MLVSFFALQTLTTRSPVAAVDADDHALVDLVARLDEGHAALLGVGEAVVSAVAALGGDQRAVARRCRSARARARSRSGRLLITPVAARGGQEGVAEADQAARRDLELQAHVRRCRR